MQRPKGNRCEVTKFEQIEPIVEPAFTVRAWEIEIPVRLPAQEPTQPGIVENFNFPGRVEFNFPGRIENFNPW